MRVFLPENNMLVWAIIWNQRVFDSKGRLLINGIFHKPLCSNVNFLKWEYKGAFCLILIRVPEYLLSFPLLLDFYLISNQGISRSSNFRNAFLPHSFSRNRERVPAPFLFKSRNARSFLRSICVPFSILNVTKYHTSKGFSQKNFCFLISLL